MSGFELLVDHCSADSMVADSSCDFLPWYLKLYLELFLALWPVIGDVVDNKELLDTY